MVSPATIEDLPDGVLSNIFITLPAKHLAQMRCVSHSWNALLSQSSFVKSHLDHSMKNNDSILLVFYQLFSFDSEPYTAHPSRSPHLNLPNFIKLPINSQLRNAYGTVIGSVNGLICLKYGSVLYIWNPSLSAVLTLPPFMKPSNDHGSMKILFRFGFDPKTDDYKVIKLTGIVQLQNNKPYLHHAFYPVKEWLQVEVYNMRKGIWELIPHRFPSHVKRIHDQDKVCVDGHNGYLHWLGSTDPDGDSETIVAFDLFTERFNEIPLPDSIVDDKRDYNAVGVLGGKLCVMSCVIDGECEVWVMDRYGVFESWMKHQVFSGFGGDIGPCGFTLHDEFLFQALEHGFALYDPVAAKTKMFKIFGGTHTTGKIVHYVDSLVWPRMR